MKAEHQKPLGTLHPLPILKWKWEHITIDFVVGLPCTQVDYDAIWVIVDRLTKSAYFLEFRYHLCRIGILGLCTDYGQSFRKP